MMMYSCCCLSWSGVSSFHCYPDSCLNCCVQHPGCIRRFWCSDPFWYYLTNVVRRYNLLSLRRYSGRCSCVDSRCRCRVRSLLNFWYCSVHPSMCLWCAVRLLILPMNCRVNLLQLCRSLCSCPGLCGWSRWIWMNFC